MSLPIKTVLKPLNYAAKAQLATYLPSDKVPALEVECITFVRSDVESRVLLPLMYGGRVRFYHYAVELPVSLPGNSLDFARIRRTSNGMHAPEFAIEFITEVETF